MPKDNQHTSALLFLGILTLPLLLIIGLQGLQLYVQHQMQERLEKEVAVSLLLPASELVWVEPGRELLVDGQLFDIQTIRYEGGQALVTGIFDTQETDIVHLLQRQGARSKNTQSLAQLFGWLQPFVATGQTLSFPVWHREAPVFAPFGLAPYTNPILGPAAPPPQV